MGTLPAITFISIQKNQKKMTLPFDPETAENNPDIEKQWAVKSWCHAETYSNLLAAVDPARLKLTRFASCPLAIADCCVP
jgi:hypothetical protein